MRAKRKSSKFDDLHSERGQELLKCFTKQEERLDGGSVIPRGTLVWAKMGGSVYWPGIVLELEDKPDVVIDDQEEIVDLNSYVMVMFLEEKFRHFPIYLEKVIPVMETRLVEQLDMVVKLSIFELKRPSCCSNKGFKLAIEYLKEFITYQPEERAKTAEKKFSEISQLKAGRRNRASTDNSEKSLKSRNRTGGGKVTLEWGSEVNKMADQFMNGCRETPSPSWFNGSSSSKRSSPLLGSESHKESLRFRKRGASMLPELKKNADEPSRKHGRYSLRPPPPVLQPAAQVITPEPQEVTVLDVPIKDADELEREIIEATRQALRRPKGGKELKEWASERFDEIDKSFRLEAQRSLVCTALGCGEEIQSDDNAAYCHDLPFHEKCLKNVSGENEEKKLKCQMCLAKACRLCDIADDSCVKCSKCDLRYHIQCLRPFPQAEIQSEVGPITCPLHFCHTCIAEHQIMKKVRNYKTSKTSLKCIECPTSYHRSCIPAACLASLMPSGYLKCPRHQSNPKGPSPKGKSRRLGCFMCNRRLVTKGKQVLVNCIKCPLSYHLECVVEDVSSFEGNDDALKEYMATFECEACFWGLYPLPGQAVWCQQANFCFWPARILYPKEMLARNALQQQVPAETFSVMYFGGKASYFDGARYMRVVPLNIGAYEVLKKIKIYTDDPKLMTAYEEGTYLMDFSESHRNGTLQQPEPIYKKIERNVYRTVKPRASHKKTQHNDTTTCSCHDDKSRDNICQLASGCINRDQAIECSDRTCGDSKRCTNRMFSNYRNQPIFDKVEAFTTPSKGWGLKTNIPLKKGHFVIEYLGEVISKDLYQWRLQRKVPNDALYFLELDTNMYIDAEYMGNLSRLINHSCEPNCSTEKYISQGKQVVGIFANCDIQPGSELTFDYDYEISGKPFSCVCGATNCRGQINRNHIRNNEVGDSGLNSTESPSQRRLDEEWNDKCEECGYAGNALLCCEAPNCNKAYHISCLRLSSVPSGTWTCPWHQTETNKTNKKKKTTTTNSEKKRAKSIIPKRNDKENLQSKRTKKTPHIRSSSKKDVRKVTKDGKQMRRRSNKQANKNNNNHNTNEHETDQNPSAVAP